MQVGRKSNGQLIQQSCRGYSPLQPAHHNTQKEEIQRELSLGRTRGATRIKSGG